MHQIFNPSSIIKIVAFFNNLKCQKERCLQDLNLRGETPLDFKSNALTTRPKQLVWVTMQRIYEPVLQCDRALFQLKPYHFIFSQIIGWQ